MSDLENQLKRIQEKLQLVIKQSSSLQKENLRLKEELEKCNRIGTEQQKKMEELKQQVEILKISSGEWNENDKKEFEKRINGYIKEIDRCISLLSD